MVRKTREHGRNVIILKLKLKIFIGMSPCKLITNGHLQIYKYTEYDQWPNKSFEHNCIIQLQYIYPYTQKDKVT